MTELPVDHMGVVGYPHSHQWQRNFFQVYTYIQAYICVCKKCGVWVDVYGRRGGGMESFCW